MGDEIYRAVRTDKHIYFTEHTKCTKDNSESLQIESCAFDVFASEEIKKCVNDNIFLFGNYSVLLPNICPYI